MAGSNFIGRKNKVCGARRECCVAQGVVASPLLDGCSKFLKKDNAAIVDAMLLKKQWKSLRRSIGGIRGNGSERQTQVLYIAGNGLLNQDPNAMNPHRLSRQTQTLSRHIV